MSVEVYKLLPNGEVQCTLVEQTIMSCNVLQLIS